MSARCRLVGGHLSSGLKPLKVREVHCPTFQRTWLRVGSGNWEHRLKSDDCILNLLAAAALDGSFGLQVEQLDTKHRFSRRCADALDEPQFKTTVSHQGS